MEDLRVSQALWTLGLLPPERLPEVAIEALSAGLDSGGLSALAGLTEEETSQSPLLFAKALGELGFPPISRQQAARMCAVWVSRQILTGTLTPEEGARRIWDASVRVNDAGFHDLDPFIYAASEVESRPDERELFHAAIMKEAHDWASRPI